MRRVAPSVIAREQLQELLGGGVGRESNIVSALVETVTRLVVQELLEAEQADYLGGRGRYERRGEGQSGSRNGYEPARVRTAEGAIEVAVPQVRGGEEPFRSSLMGFLDGNSEVLERLVCEMYARGLSTRDVEDAFRDATGATLISKSAVSEVTDRLWEDYQGFISRDLSGISVEYLFVDAVFPVAAPPRGQGSGASRLVHRLRRTQTPAALGGGQQGVPVLLDGVLPQHAGSGHARTDHHHQRRGTGADHRHHHVFPGEHPDPMLVSPTGQHPRQAAPRDRWRGHGPRLRGA
jgi:hypothetical protein